jgi:hypothetical protein
MKVAAGDAPLQEMKSPLFAEKLIGLYPDLGKA